MITRREVESFVHLKTMDLLFFLNSHEHAARNKGLLVCQAHVRLSIIISTYRLCWWIWMISRNMGQDSPFNLPRLVLCRWIMQIRQRITRSYTTIIFRLLEIFTRWKWKLSFSKNFFPFYLFPFLFKLNWIE